METTQQTHRTISRLLLSLSLPWHDASPTLWLTTLKNYKSLTLTLDFCYPTDSCQLSRLSLFFFLSHFSKIWIHVYDHVYNLFPILLMHDPWSFTRNIELFLLRILRQQFLYLLIWNSMWPDYAFIIFIVQLSSYKWRHGGGNTPKTLTNFLKFTFILHWKVYWIN